MQKTRRQQRVAQGLFFGMAWLAAGPGWADEFTVSVEPSYPPDQAQEVYKPLLDYLSRTTGHTFTINTPRNYHLHWRDMRRATMFDFVYEEGHFVDYRAQAMNYEPLVRKSSDSIYTLLVDEQYAERGVAGLVGRRIVSMPAPSLGFAMLAEMFTNPVSQPDFRSEASSWRDGVEMVFAGDAEAAVVPSFIAEQYPNLISMKSSRGVLGAALSASPNVSAEVKAAVRDAMLKLHEDQSAYETLVELGATEFVAANAAEYRGLEKTLSSFFGYVAPGSGGAVEDN